MSAGIFRPKGMGRGRRSTGDQKRVPCHSKHCEVGRTWAFPLSKIGCGWKVLSRGDMIQLRFNRIPGASVLKLHKCSLGHGDWEGI